ncbi:SAM-dependent methyltransferase [Kribbella sp. NPDC004536]|uniref:SAM-dependent methyltransferase n=1 Tax=Kribbella sp. NPDC004536 TaxID=3364106 RepID=UPI0036B5AB5D
MVTASNDHYGAAYETFNSELLTRIRSEAFGEDIGQNGWQTADEQDVFLDWLGLGPHHRVLDFGCGAGGPTLRIAEKTGCVVDGIDIDIRAIEAARDRAKRSQVEHRASFHVSGEDLLLPFGNGAFDAVISVDAINHVLDRVVLFAEWRRLLRPGGRVLFTNPAVMTGPISGEDLTVRSSIGRFLFTPAHSDPELLQATGFRVVRQADRTQNVAVSARRRFEARARHATDLIRSEGAELFARQQRFFDTAYRLAEQGCLSRHLVLAEAV